MTARAIAQGNQHIAPARDALDLFLHDACSGGLISSSVKLTAVTAALMPGSPGLASPLGDQVIWRGSVARRLPLGLFLPTVPLRTHYP